jgi:hypothetical protein
VYPAEELKLADETGCYYGPLVYGKRHGHGKYIEGNVEYVGQWDNDNIHGNGCIKNTATKISFSGVFIINMMVYGTYTWPNGAIYVGEFENNEMHGQGTLKWSSGEKYEGAFANGAMHGQGIYTGKKGVVYNADFREGKAIKLEFIK